MSKLVSIIVPVYNVDKYLERCLESVINQSYKKLEIILVDDGSTDDSGTICDEYKKKDSRILVVHKENGGLSDARNAGINLATGEYLTFIDSDDYVSTDMIKCMVDLAEKLSCKVIQCKFVSGSDANFQFTYSGKYSIYNANYAFETRDVKVTAWGKLYDIDLIRGRFFPIGKINEDEFYTYQCIYEGGNIAVMDDALYYYYQRPESIMHKKLRTLNLDALDAYEERIKYFLDRKEERLAIISIKEKCIREAFLSAKAKGCCNEKKRKYLKELYCSDYSLIKKDKFDKKEMIFLKLYRYFPLIMNIFLEGKIG